MATCSHADRVIPLLHDNELQNPLRREIVAHMAICVTCARTFSVLEREQELLTQVVEERVDSIDFANFWQAVETRLAEPPLSWAARFRLWYESWRPTWALPRPALAFAALMLVSLALAPFYLNDTSLNSLLALVVPETKDPSEQPLPPPTTEQSPDQRLAPPESQPDSPSIQKFNVADRDNEAEIESIYTSGAGEVVIHVWRDRQSNITVISLGDGTSEYAQ